jgi:hypothetical protein
VGYEEANPLGAVMAEFHMELPESFLRRIEFRREKYLLVISIG